MAFEVALKRAQELGGDTVRFAQTIDCCTGFTARWIKCQFLEQDFWVNANPFKAPIVTSSVVDLPLKSGGSLTTRQAVMTADGNAKLTAVYSRIDQSRADRGKAGKGTTEYLAASNKVGTQLDAIGLKQSSGTFPDVTLGKMIADPSFRGAFHISLQVSFDSSSGLNPLYGTSGLSFHSLAAFRPSEDIVKFFDPNMGEVSLSQSKFPEWFQFYQQRWSSSKMYGKFDCWVLSYIKGLDGLSNMSTAARNAYRKRLRQKQGYAVTAVTKSAAAGPLPSAASLPPPPPPPVPPVAAAAVPPAPAADPVVAAALAAMDAQLAQLQLLMADLST